MKRILILTAGFGEGHNAAARNIRDALEQIAPDEVQAEVCDLFESSYGIVNELARRAYLATINHAPRIWGRIYHALDTTELVRGDHVALARLRESLAGLVRGFQPDVVLSTYPVYPHVLAEIHRQGGDRRFALVTVVTDSLSINSVWFRAPSDAFLVANEATADVLQRGGVDPARIHVTGFPVSARFAELDPAARPDPAGERPRVLYMVNSGKRRAPEFVRRLLENPQIDLTVTVGRDARLKAEIESVVGRAQGRVELVGWTSRMPELMASHHLLIGKAGGATVQEALAATLPMLITQVVPGQEEGNARLLLECGGAAMATTPAEVARETGRIFAHRASDWHRMRAALASESRPRAALDIARFLLDQADAHNPGPPNLSHLSPPDPDRSGGGTFGIGPARKEMLLCDLHTHTTYSDGKLPVRELVDFYGQREFDVLCVTDHICDPERLFGKVANLSGLVLCPAQVGEYFEVLERERRRALRKYGLLLMTGLEFNKDGLTKKSSAHLLGIDLREPIHPGLGIVETIAAIHAQGGLAIAAHPHEFHTVWGKDTLYFWENIDRYAPLLDAWEVANRDDLFNPVGLKRLPFVANSDFHKPKHIHSWKTVLFCEKDPEAVKQCIRLNRDLAITLYREHKIGSRAVPVADVDGPAIAARERFLAFPNVARAGSGRRPVFAGSGAG
jgi:processive 1,2-diacylglycerol beta-glucosyltransferase